MGNLTFHVVDSGTGKPIYNAEVIVNISNKPCSFLAIGCSSGDPYTDNGYTDSQGDVSFSLLYNTATTVDYQVMADGYDTQNGSMSISGANLIDENVWGSKNINLVSVNNQQPPPNQGPLANVVNVPGVNTVLEDLGYSASNAGLIGSIELTIIIVFVALALIAIAILTVVL